MSDHVAEHVEGKLGVTVQHAGVEAGVLLGRVHVELAAYGLDRGRDLLRGAIRGSLEKQVLQEVRRPCRLGVSCREPTDTKTPRE